MDIFSIDLSVQEITLLRQSLDVINITGKDAKFVGNLQYKLETELQTIRTMLVEREAQEARKQSEKAAELERAIAAEARKQKKAEQAVS
jgi:hypothetical protein